MRKLVSFLHASLDGYVQGANEWDLGWISYDGELEAFADEAVSTVDTVLWGRATYEGMKAYWPTAPENPDASEHVKKHAEWINKTDKVVFSRTLEQSEWSNTTLVKDDMAGAVMELKRQPGQDMMILGSPRLAHSLIRLGLIDEFRISISPVVLGQGLSLFSDVVDRIPLELVSSKTFNSGAIGLVYRVKKNEAGDKE